MFFSAWESDCTRRKTPASLSLTWNISYIKKYLNSILNAQTWSSIMYIHYLYIKQTRTLIFTPGIKFYQSLFTILRENKINFARTENKYCNKVIVVLAIIAPSWSRYRDLSRDLSEARRQMICAQDLNESRYFFIRKSMRNCFVIRPVSFFFARLPQFHNVVWSARAECYSINKNATDHPW